MDYESGDANHGVRQYSQLDGRFYCPDALWEKYYSLSPYQYSGNNPILHYDNNGLDYAIAVNRNGAYGLGHLFLYFQEDGNWWRVDMGGTGVSSSDPDSRRSFISEPLTLVAIVLGADIKASLKMDPVPNGLPKNGSKVGDEYIEYTYFQSTADEDQRISSAATYYSSEYMKGNLLYNGRTENCVHAIIRIMQKAIDPNFFTGDYIYPNDYYDAFVTQYPPAIKANEFEKSANQFMNEVNQKLNQEMQNDIRNEVNNIFNNNG